MKLGTKTKQPGERRSYTINYSYSLPEGDFIESARLKDPAPAGLIVDQITIINPRMRFFVDAGVDKSSYKLTFVAVSHDGLRFEDEVIIKIKEA